VKLEANTQVHIAKLHHDKIALYERIHDEMTSEYAQINRGRHERIDIYRLDDVLIMLTERRAGEVPEPTELETEQDRRWHASLAECFAQPWQRAEPIFMLSLAAT
jgi:hypothetical protein